jgi:hypothetical protein
MLSDWRGYESPAPRSGKGSPFRSDNENEHRVDVVPKDDVASEKGLTWRGECAI